MSPFAWQRNKAIFFYFTQSPISKTYSAPVHTGWVFSIIHHKFLPKQRAMVNSLKHPLWYPRQLGRCKVLRSYSKPGLPPLSKSQIHPAPLGNSKIKKISCPDGKGCQEPFQVIKGDLSKERSNGTRYIWPKAGCKDPLNTLSESRRLAAIISSPKKLNSGHSGKILQDTFENYRPFSVCFG